MNSVATLRKLVGEDTFGSYVISMTNNASQILEVLVLMRFAGLCTVDDEGKLSADLPVAPLFETIEDIKTHRSYTSYCIRQPPVSRAVPAFG